MQKFVTIKPIAAIKPKGTDVFKYKGQPLSSFDEITIMVRNRKGKGGTRGNFPRIDMQIIDTMIYINYSYSNSKKKGYSIIGKIVNQFSKKMKCNYPKKAA